MKGSLFIGKVSGIKIFIHWTFILLIAWIVMDNILEKKNTVDVFYTLAFILAIFFFVTLHELGHALTAKYFHYSTKDITLLPIGGMARMDEIPENPKHELLVALAGPAVNIIVAILLYPLIYWFGKIPTFFTILFDSAGTLLYNLFLVNLLLAFFNLIPAFPMDGGRVFRAALSYVTDRVKATAIAARTGQVIAIIFFSAGFFFNPMLSFAGIFIFLMAQTENDYVRSKSFLHDYKVKDVLIRNYFFLDVFDTVSDAVKLLLDTQAKDFLIMEKGHVVGTLDRDRIIHLLSEKGKEAPLVTAMNTKLKFLSPEMPLDKVFLEFKTSRNEMYPVLENNKLIGIVDLNNILELMLVKTVAEKNPAIVQKNTFDLESATV